MNRNRNKPFYLFFLFLLCFSLFTQTALTATFAEETPETAEETEEPAAEEAEEPAELSEETEEAPEELPEELEEVSEPEEELEEEAPEKAEYTILLYICGSNLEGEMANATHNLMQILNSSYSKDKKVRVLVLTGGTYRWHMDSKYTITEGKAQIAMGIPAESTNVWEVYGADAADADFRSKMVWLSDGTNTVTGGKLVNTSDSENLKKFINWGITYAPAKKYGVILWDHGSGPCGGFANDDYARDGQFQEGATEMKVNQIADALRTNNLVKSGAKFEFIDFDTCLMGGLETTLAFADTTNYHIGSPELEPGRGQDYQWLTDLGKNPEMTGFEIGKRMVDLMYQYYNSGENKMEATLTVTNIDELVKSGLIGALNELNTTLMKEVSEPQNGEYLFFDEYNSAINAFRYGGDCAYFDLGNLIQKLTVAEKEITLKNLEAEEIDDKNHYDMTKLRAVCDVLNNDKIFYSRATDDLSTKDSFYRSVNGEVEYTSLKPSGSFLFFTPSTQPGSVLDYGVVMNETIKGMPDGSQKEFLSSYLKTMLRYALVAETGRFTALMTAMGTPEDAINYDSVKTAIQKMGYWETEVAKIIELTGASEEALKPWLNEVINQQKKETVRTDKVTSYDAYDLNGKGYKITIDGIRKRSISDVAVEVTAELPVAKKYLENHTDIAKKINWNQASEFSLGTMKGEIVRDFDQDIKDIDEYFKKYVKWLNATNATWMLEGISETMDVLQDENKVVHAIDVVYNNDVVMVPAAVTDKNGEYRLVALEFSLSETDSRLENLIVTNGDSRTRVNPRELPETQTYELMSVKVVRGAGNEDYYIPISGSTFKVNARNADTIKIVSKNANEIPDIETRTGEKGFTRTAYAIDIYGYRYDITEPVINKPAGSIYSMKRAYAPEAVYNAKVQKPAVEMDGIKLKEGTDYTLKTAGAELKNVGTYTIRLEGKGSYFDELETEFVIRKEDIANTSISGIDNAEYTGKAIDPKPVVTLGDVTLKEGTDYKLSYKNNVNIGEATVTITGINNLQGSVPVTFNIVEVLDQIEVYRMYNPNSGEHFYTSAKEEKEALEKAGWKYEGVAFHSLSSSSHPLYRVYNPNAGDHHYTESTAERDHLIKVGWKEEGIAFYVTDQQGGVPLYRLYNPNAEAGAHHYTASVKERDFLITAGWKSEGVGFYAVQ